MGEGKFVAFRIQSQTTIEFELQAEHKQWSPRPVATMQTVIIFGIPRTKAIYKVHINCTVKYPLRNYMRYYNSIYTIKVCMLLAIIAKANNIIAFVL